MNRSTTWCWIVACVLVIVIVPSCTELQPRVSPIVTISEVFGVSTISFSVSLNDPPREGDLITYSVYTSDQSVAASGSRAVTETGSTEFTVSDLEDGRYRLFVYIDSAVGTLTPAAGLPRPFTVDTAPPETPELDTDSGDYSLPIYLSMIPADSGLTEETVRYTTDGSLPDSQSPEFPDAYILAGNTTLTLVRFDAAGNASSSAVYTYGGAAGPTVSISNGDPAGPTNATVSLSSTSTLADTYLWEVASGAGATLGTPAASSTDFDGPAGTAGTYRVRLTVTSTAGLTATDEITVLWDDLAPTVDVGPDPGPTGTTQTVHVSVMAAEDATMSWTSDTGNVTFGNSTGAITTIAGVPATEESHTITCTVTDSAGNIASDSLVFEWDDVAPTATIDTADPVSWTGSASTLSATSDGSSYWWEVVSGGGGTSFTAQSAVSTDFTGATGAERVYLVRFTAYDDAGNSASDEIEVEWDDLAPRLSAGSDLPVSNQSGIVSAAISDLTPVSIAWTGTGVTFGDATAGTTSVTGTTGAATTYTLTCTATDSAGNVSSDTVDFIWDDAAPTVSITTADPVGWTNATETLSATATDATRYLWEVEAPRTGYTIATPTQLSTDFSGATGHEGPYLLRFTAFDEAGNSASDTITVLWDAAISVANDGSTYTFPDGQVQTISALIMESGSGIASVVWNDPGAPNVTLQSAVGPYASIDIAAPGASASFGVDVADNLGNSTSATITVTR